MGPVGKPIPHESAREHVTGQAMYTDDLVGRYQGLLHAWPVQAPHAHARITALQVGDALAVPGVVRVLTGADVPGENNVGPVRHDEPLFPDLVEFYGQAVAWVMAETEAAARLGASKVAVTYEPLPAVSTIEAALEQEVFLTGPLKMGRGDATAALAEAPYRLTGEFYLGGQEHFYLETQSAIAMVDEAGQVLVHSSTQHPSETQEVVARVLGRARSEVTVQSLRMGGAFGGKEVQANTWAAVAALGAALSGRPVRVRLNRVQDMTLTGKRHPFLARYQVGYDEQGRLQALDLTLYADGGYSLDLSEAILYRAMFHSDNAYYIPHMAVTGWVVKTHKASNTAFRGFGGPQGMLVIEEIIDRVARSLRLAPEAVRATNFYREGQSTHYGQVVKDAERISRIWAELLAESGFESRRAEIAAYNQQSPNRKRGIAMTPVKFGISFTTSFFNQAGALVLIYQDGTVQVNHGGTEMGQGLHTKMRQVAAQALGIPLDAVRLMPTRTDKVPNTSATAASSGTDLNGGAVKAACDELKGRLAVVAGRLLGVPEQDIRFADGQAYPVGKPERAVPFDRVVREAYLSRVQLFSAGYYRTPDIHFDTATGTGKPFHYFAYGAAVSEVEVDAFTGQYELRRVDILHDVGDSLNPLIDRGQVEGGFVQGLGWLTLEELVYTDQGRLATAGASTYKLPGFSEVPEGFNVRLLPRATEPGVVYGSKAVGEPPFMLAISVREALKDAVSAFGGGRWAPLASPATPEAVYWALEAVHRGAPVR